MKSFNLLALSCLVLPVACTPTLPLLATANTSMVEPKAANTTKRFESWRSYVPLLLPITKFDCTGNHLDMRDYEVALKNMRDWCDIGNKLGRKAETNAFINRNTKSYICNFGKTNGCNSAEILAMAEFLDKFCGPGKTGWVYMKDWRKAYGRDTRWSGGCKRNTPGFGMPRAELVN
jgi:hypothetical protein